MEISEIKYDIDDLETKIKRLPFQVFHKTYTRSGYGSKIPTEKMVKIDNRWHRVYCIIYSNVGTCYIIKNKKMIIIY